MNPITAFWKNEDIGPDYIIEKNVKVRFYKERGIKYVYLNGLRIRLGQSMFAGELDRRTVSQFKNVNCEKVFIADVLKIREENWKPFVTKGAAFYHFNPWKIEEALIQAIKIKNQ